MRVTPPILIIMLSHIVGFWVSQVFIKYTVTFLALLSWKGKRIKQILVCYQIYSMIGEPAINSINIEF